MKTHKFEIKEKIVVKSNHFANDLLEEISNDKKQLDFVIKVGEKTSKVHAKILANFIKELNKSLKPLKMEFTDVIPSMYKAVSGCKIHISYLYFPRQKRFLILRVRGVTTNIDGNQYRVQSGKYVFEYGVCSYNYNANEKGRQGLVENTNYYYLSSENKIEELLERNKSMFKDELRKW